MNGASGPSTPDSPSTRLAYERTHLANERTFAAWLRTGLSVAAGGIAIAHLIPEPSRDSATALALGGVFVIMGVAIVAYGAHEFARVRRQLFSDDSVQNRVAGPSTVRAVYGLTVVIAILLIAVLMFLWSHRGLSLGGASAARVAVIHQGVGPRLSTRQ